jgi:hypothetical protein
VHHVQPSPTSSFPHAPLGANTQSASLFVNINNIDWSSGVPIRYKLKALPTGVGSIEIFNNTSGLLLASRTYANAASPLRLGNAIRIYAKTNADLGTARAVVSTTFANGNINPAPTIETLGNNTYSEAAQVIAIPTDAVNGVQVEGAISLSWSGAMPTGSRLSVTINLGNVVCAAPPNLRPLIALDAPANISIYKTPAYPEFSATASDADGRVVKVEYFANGAKIGGAEAAPWKFKWNNAAPGQYTVRARATDDKGEFTDSVTRPDHGGSPRAGRAICCSTYRGSKCPCGGQRDCGSFVLSKERAR